MLYLETARHLIDGADTAVFWHDVMFSFSPVVCGSTVSWKWEKQQSTTAFLLGLIYKRKIGLARAVALCVGIIPYSLVKSVTFIIQ